MQVKIPNTDIIIGEGYPVFTIAEIGKGFIQSEDDRPVSEYLENAKALVKAAFEAGATSVKFQLHNVEDEQLDINVTSEHFKGSDRYSWVTRNTLATPVKEFWKPLKKYCDELGIIFFATPMSRGAARILHEEVGQPLWKVGSADVLDFVLLDYITSTGIPIIFSAGMSSEEEIDKTLSFLYARTDQIILMHCVSIYPCPREKLNLGTIKYFQDKYKLPIGFSSHSVEWESSVAAVNIGAVVIEKHFTFDRNLWGSDHKVSLLPDEFKAMVDSLKRGEQFDTNNFGDVVKSLQKEEIQFRPLFRKSLMFGQDLLEGTVITKEMLYAMRPQVYAGGLPSEEYENVLGKKVKKSVKKYDPVTFEILV